MRPVRKIIRMGYGMSHQINLFYQVFTGLIALILTIDIADVTVNWAAGKIDNDNVPLEAGLTGVRIGRTGQLDHLSFFDSVFRHGANGDPRTIKHL